MLGRWYAAAAYYRREHRLFSTELLGRNLGRNDAALIDTWFLDKAQAAGVESVSGLNVTLDADVPLPAGAHAVFRNELGKEWGPVAVTATADPHTVTVTPRMRPSSRGGPANRSIPCSGRRGASCRSRS